MPITKASGNSVTAAAKGDLVVGNATNDSSILSVGANGETLVADSSTSTGLRWNPSYQAGKNFIINGGFDIWQRGTSFNTTSGGSGYHADRWTYYGGGTGTITRSTALLRSGAEYAWRWTSTAANSNCDLYMLLETPMAVQLQGQTVTFSIYVAGTAGKTVSLYLYSSTVDNDGLFGTWTQVTPTGSSSLTSSGSYQRLTATFSVPTTTRSIRLAVGTNAMANTEFISYTQAQLEVGSTATAFSRAGGNIAGEFQACQRYFQVIKVGQAWGTWYSTTDAALMAGLPVPMRVTPTATFSTNYTSAITEIGVTDRTPTSYAAYKTSNQAFSFLANGMTTSATVRNGAVYIGADHQLSAEL